MQWRKKIDILAHKQINLDLNKQNNEPNSRSKSIKIFFYLPKRGKTKHEIYTSNGTKMM